MSGLVRVSAFLLALVPLGGLSAQEKSAVPGPAEQTDAEKMIKEVFKEDYAKRGIPERQALARLLLAQGQKSSDDRKFQFVLLREARDMAGSTGDSATALQAVDEMARSFTIDVPGMKTAAISAAAKTAKTADDFRILVRSALRLIDQALAADDYDGADKYSNLASQLAKKSQDVALVSRSTTRAKEIADLKVRFEKLRKARETLAADPEDPGANLTVGQFLCYQKGDWEKGLELLEKSRDPVLGPLAKKDRAASGDAATLVSVGDGWWALAEKDSPPAKDNLKQRACVSYAKAAGALSGLSKTKVEKRLNEGRIALVLRGPWVDFTESRLFNVPGKSGDPVEVVGKPDGITTLKMQFPKGEYDGVSARLIVDPAKSSVAFFIYEGPSAFALVVDTERGFFANMKGVAGGWNLDHTDWWTKDAETVLTAILGEGEYILYMNGVEKHRLKTTKTRIEYLGFECRTASIKFDQIRLRRAD